MKAAIIGFAPHHVGFRLPKSDTIRYYSTLVMSILLSGLSLHIMRSVYVPQEEEVLCTRCSAPN